MKTYIVNYADKESVRGRRTHYEKHFPNEKIMTVTAGSKAEAKSVCRRLLKMESLRCGGKCSFIVGYASVTPDGGDVASPDGTMQAITDMVVSMSGASGSSVTSDIRTGEPPYPSFNAVDRNEGDNVYRNVTFFCGDVNDELFMATLCDEKVNKANGERTPCLTVEQASSMVESLLLGKKDGRISYTKTYIHKRPPKDADWSNRRGNMNEKDERECIGILANGMLKFMSAAAGEKKADGNTHDE